MLPTARVRQDFHSHNSTLFFLVRHHPSAWYPSCPDPCGYCVVLRPLNPSPFILAYSHVQSCLVSLRFPVKKKKQGIFFHSLLMVFLSDKRNTLKAFYELSVLKNFWLIQAGRLRAVSKLIYYFTHQQSHVAWRGWSWKRIVAFEKNI